MKDTVVTRTSCGKTEINGIEVTILMVCGPEENSLSTGTQQLHL